MKNPVLSGEIYGKKPHRHGRRVTQRSQRNVDGGQGISRVPGEAGHVPHN